MSYVPPPNGFRTFLIIWITQSISVFGSALTFFAINIWLVQVLYPRPEQKPELAFALSAMSIAFALPVVFGAPLAGAWADRHDRKRTMIVMDLASGGVSLGLMALVLAGELNLPVLIVLMVLLAMFGAYHNAAFDTSYAMLVSESLLPRANGMMQTIWSLSGILSPAIAASLIAAPNLARQGYVPGALGAWLGSLSNGVPLTMAIDAVTFFLAGIVLVFLFVPSPKRADLHGDAGQPQKSFWADIKEGAFYIWHRRPMLWLLATFTVANFAGSPLGVFEPLIVKFNLASDWTARGFSYETAIALLATFGSVGGVAGGLLISVWGGLKKRRVYGVLIAMIISGAALIVLGISPLIYLTAAMALLFASMTPIMNAHSQAIWQSQTPRELQGRVFAVRRVIAQFTWPLSTALAGWAGGFFNPGLVVAALGTFFTLFCVAQLFNPYLLRVEDKDYLDQRAAQAVAKQV